MNRNRFAVVAGAVIIFAVVGAILIFANQSSHTGQPVALSVTVTGGTTMSPSDLSARQNDIVTIKVTSDTRGEVHLHGYDKHFFCIPGQTIEQTFTAYNTGTFEIEWESTSTHLGQLVVTP